MPVLAFILALSSGVWIIFVTSRKWYGLTLSIFQNALCSALHHKARDCSAAIRPLLTGQNRLTPAGNGFPALRPRTLSAFGFFAWRGISDWTITISSLIDRIRQFRSKDYSQSPYCRLFRLPKLVFMASVSAETGRYFVGRLGNRTPHGA